MRLEKASNPVPLGYFTKPISTSRRRLDEHDGFRVAAAAFRIVVERGASPELQSALYALVQEEAAKAERHLG